MNDDSVLVLDPVNRKLIDRGLASGIKTYCGPNCTVSLMVMAIDGLLRATCCCPHENESESATPALKAQDCCQREVTDGKPVPVAAARPEDREVAEGAAGRDGGLVDRQRVVRAEPRYLHLG